MIKGFYPLVGDLLHAGHNIAIQEAKENCDYLIVGLNVAPDGKSPIQSPYERYMQLRANKYIDEIIPYAGKADMEVLCASLDYQVRFLGMDYYDKQQWDGRDVEVQLGKSFHYLRRTHGLSSTELKYRIINSEKEKN